MNDEDLECFLEELRARLRQDGWDLVSYDPETTNATFKRLEVAPAQELDEPNPDNKE